MNPTTSVLLTDLYQLTMLQAYYDRGMDETAVFEMFIRKLPDSRGFLVGAGLEQIVEYLETLRFTAEELSALHGSGFFTSDFLGHLEGFRFTGDVTAMPEGTVFFANEPVLRVIAPLSQAQIVESRLINLFTFQTLIASKAARVVLASQGKTLLDFGFRRAHGAEAGVYAARAAYLAGFDGTATVFPALRFGIPMSGTMAHAYILAHDVEEEAFEEFARSQPNNAVFLLDTYDTEEGARKVTRVAARLKEDGIAVKAVRLDSGDFLDLSKKVRRILDEGGCQETRILVSGDMDEYAIHDLLTHGAPIDGFGVGTKLATSSDSPYLSTVYKLQEYAGKPRCKRSMGKATLPGRKQLYRRYDETGRMAGDTLTLENDPQDGEALLQPVMREGKRIGPLPSLEEIRERAKSGLSRLPEPLHRLERYDYPVVVSPALEKLARETEANRETERSRTDDPSNAPVMG
jgi:nicotinate phosphoribosyltransferase